MILNHYKQYWRKNNYPYYFGDCLDITYTAYFQPVLALVLLKICSAVKKLLCSPYEKSLLEAKEAVFQN